MDGSSVQATKRCSKCKRFLPFDSFGIMTSAKDGLQFRCRECRSSVAAQRYVPHPWVRPSVEERFWSKVIRGRPEDCWEWQASTSNGYGAFQLKNPQRVERSHRMVWLLVHGDIPNGVYVCHHCDNRKCCNPDHLFLGTHQDNMADMVSKGRGGRPPLSSISRGASHWNAKLSDDAVRTIRQRVANGEKQRDISREMGLSHTTIGMIVRRRLWRHVV